MASRVKVFTTGSFASGTAVTSETANTDPDGSLKYFSGTLAHGAIQNSSVTFTATIAATPVTATDNGSGIVSGTGVTGTINYTTGIWTLTYTTAPDNTTNITASYTWVAVGMSIVLAESTGLAGASGITKFRGKLANTKIIPGSVVFHINFLSTAVHIRDNKNRELIHEKVADGYVNYTDGSFVIYFVNPPDTAANLTVDYNHRSGTYNDTQVKISTEIFNYVFLYNGTGSSITARLMESPDDISYVEKTTVTISAGSYKSASITQNKYLRIISWNNAGLTLEFFNLQV